MYKRAEEQVNTHACYYCYYTFTSFALPVVVLRSRVRVRVRVRVKVMYFHTFVTHFPLAFFSTRAVSAAFKIGGLWYAREQRSTGWDGNK